MVENSKMLVSFSAQFFGNGVEQDFWPETLITPLQILK